MKNFSVKNTNLRQQYQSSAKGFAHDILTMKRSWSDLKILYNRYLAKICRTLGLKMVPLMQNEDSYTTIYQYFIRPEGILEDLRISNFEINLCIFLY